MEKAAYEKYIMQKKWTGQSGRTGLGNIPADRTVPTASLANAAASYEASFTMINGTSY